MINGRPIHPLLKVALVVVVGYLVLGQLIHYALLPLAAGLVAWGIYRIVRAERRAAPRRAASAPVAGRRVRRSKSTVRSIRIDPDAELRVPKDWR